MVKVSLCKRHYGVHSVVGETFFPGVISNYASKKQKSGDYEKIYEKKIAKLLVERFYYIPISASSLLLVIDGTGQRNLKIFRPWAKYFDSYSLFLDRESATSGKGKSDTKCIKDRTN